MSAASYTEEPSLGAIVAQLRRRWWIVGASTAVFIALFGTIAFLTTPVFRTTTWLLPSDNARAGSLGAAMGSLGNLAAAVGIDLNAAQDSRSQEALAVLHSREFRAAFVTDLDLMPQLFPTRWDAVQKHWKGGLMGAPDLGDAIRLLEEIVVVGRSQKTGLYSLQVEWTNPAQAAQWANTLVQRVNRELRDRAIRHSNELIDYLEKELATTESVDTRDAISQLLAAQINERMFATVNEDYAFMVVEHAPVPDRKERPRKGLQLMLGAITGGLLGSIWILFAPRLSRDYLRSSRA